MTRRPTIITCSGCGEAAGARRARQAVLCWPRSASGTGTMTDPQHIHQTEVWICEACHRLLDGPVRARSRWGVLDRVNTLCRQLVELWLRPPSGVQRDLFGNETARKEAG